MKTNQKALGILAMVMAFAGSMMLAPIAQAREWKTYENTKYGFSLKIPAEFELQSEEKGASWIYQPGSAKSAKGTKKKKKKKFSVGLRVKGVSLGTSQSEETTTDGSGGGGGLESALSIHVNWVWMPDVSPGTLYKANMDSVKKDISSPDANYRDPIVFSKKKGYAHEGNTFWYKEVDKSKSDEIHRWLIHASGNKSDYGVILGGVFGQFEEWGPVYEEVVKSFKLIPMKK
ncbi:MAG: hypothetical protein L3K26_07050 [Candidatus Hydrogenedentes bacterium]|nr:hypothetical protein [Candidatus Hydrogenedentota bacterium]